MEVLVRLAHQTLKEACPTAVAALQDPTIVPHWFMIDLHDELLLHTEPSQYAGLKTLSEQERFQRFETFLSQHASVHKTSRRGAKKSLKNFAELQSGCHVLESKMREGETLSKCGWCKQVTYFSRECQKTHWNTAHKKECAGRKK
jgi:hypothetical protein